MMFSFVTMQRPMGGKALCPGKRFTAVGAVKDSKHLTRIHSTHVHRPARNKLHVCRDLFLSQREIQHIAGLCT